MVKTFSPSAEHFVKTKMTGYYTDPFNMVTDMVFEGLLEQIKWLYTIQKAHVHTLIFIWSNTYEYE